MNISQTGMMAGFAGITAAWSYIRGMFSRAISFVFVTVDYENWAADAVMHKLWKEYRFLKFGHRRFAAYDHFVRPLNRHAVVGFEKNGSQMTFFKGWRPIFVGSTPSGNGDMSVSNSHASDHAIRLTFIRGLFDIEAFTINAIQEMDQHTHVKNKVNRRYRIQKRFGRNGLGYGEEKESYPHGSKVSEKSNDESGTYKNRPLIWKRDDLGNPVSDVPFDKLAYEGQVKEFLVEIEDWYNSKDWYQKRGISWRLSGLLYGVPGSGKSSFSSAVAQKLDLPIESLDLVTMNNAELYENWRYALSLAPCIILLEDIDRIFDENRNIRAPSSGQGLTLDCLLNCISGVESNDGVLLLMTANDVSKLDPALIRKGRVDQEVLFGTLAKEGRYQIANRIMDECAHLIEATVRDGNGETGAQFERRCQNIALREYCAKKRQSVLSTHSNILHVANQHTGGTVH